jgi:predicted metal-dependent HD superfamily phosphohydrolase
MMDEDIVEAAEGLYSDDLPYHNTDHMRDALEAAEELLERCRRHDIDVDEEVVRYAVLFHDAGYHHDHEAKGFDSKEAYSTHLAGEVLAEHGIDEETIERVQDCIESTREDAAFDEAEEKVVRAADLSGLAADYRTFEENALDLKDEIEMLHGEDMDRGEWLDEVEDTIRFYLSQDIRLTPEHDSKGVSVFHARARHNLRRFFEEHRD